MSAIYEKSGSSESVFISGPELLGSLGLSDQELGDACKYLENERLIKGDRSSWGHHTPYMIRITHQGIRGMEQSRRSPEESTRHFPPAISIIHVKGDIIGSAIQSGSPGAQQQVSVGELDPSLIVDFLNELEARAPEIGLPDNERKELAAEIATIRAQVESPRPKKTIIHEGFRSIRAILEGAAGVATATGLLDLLRLIRF